MGVEKYLTFRLTVGDTDCYDCLTPYAISNLFQEVASLHAEELGCGYDVMIARNLAWIVARNKITILKSQNVGKIVTVKTWPHPNGRFDFERDYLLFDEKNELIAKGSSKWLIYDLKRKFLCSSKGIMEDVSFNSEKVYEDKFDKINYGNIEEYELVLKHQIVFSDLDHYGHMNNAKYLVLMMDALNLEKNEVLNDIQVDYINQGYLNRVINIYKKKIDNTYYLIGKEEDKIIFAIKANIKA